MDPDTDVDNVAGLAERTAFDGEIVARTGVADVRVAGSASAGADGGASKGTNPALGSETGRGRRGGKGELDAEISVVCPLGLDSRAGLSSFLPRDLRKLDSGFEWDDPIVAFACSRSRSQHV